MESGVWVSVCVRVCVRRTKTYGNPESGVCKINVPYHPPPLRFHGRPLAPPLPPTFNVDGGYARALGKRGRLFRKAPALHHANATLKCGGGGVAGQHGPGQQHLSEGTFISQTPVPNIRCVWCLSSYLPVYLSVYLSVKLSVCLSVCLPACLPACLSHSWIFASLVPMAPP